MTDYQRILDTYGLVSLKSGEMVEAAKYSDWDRLIELEKDCRALVDNLRTQDVATKGAPRPDRGYIKRKAELIRKVLADDAMVRRYTEPWMDQLQILLGSARKGQRLQQAYGTANGQA